MDKQNSTHWINKYFILNKQKQQKKTTFKELFLFESERINETAISLVTKYRNM